jgi:hypothetical protein
MIFVSRSISLVVIGLILLMTFAKIRRTIRKKKSKDKTETFIDNQL